MEKITRSQTKKRKRWKIQTKENGNVSKSDLPTAEEEKESNNTSFGGDLDAEKAREDFVKDWKGGIA